MARKDEGIQVTKTSKMEKESNSSLDRNNIVKLRDMLYQRDVEIEKIQDDIIDIESKAKRQERKLKKEIEKLKEEIEDLNSENKSDRQDLNKFRQKVKDLEKKNNKLQDEIEMKDEEIKEKEQKWAQEMREKFNDEKKLVEQFKGLGHLEDESNRLKEVIKRLESEKEELNNSITIKTTEKQNVIERLKRKIDEHIATNESLKRDLDRLTSEVEKSKKTESEYIEKNEQLNSLLKNQQFTIEDLSMKFKEKEKELAEYKNNASTKLTSSAISTASSLVQESMNVTVSNAPMKTPPNEDSDICPNCSVMVAVSVLETHLIKCLEEF